MFEHLQYVNMYLAYCKTRGHAVKPYKVYQLKMRYHTLNHSSAGIRGVEVIGEAEFIIPDQGGSFEWKEYGMRLHVPEGSLPPDRVQGQHQGKSLWAISASSGFRPPQPCHVDQSTP